MSQGTNGHKPDACIRFCVYEDRKNMRMQPFFVEKCANPNVFSDFESAQHGKITSDSFVIQII